MAFSSAVSILRLYARVAPSERGGYRLARLARRLQPRARWSGPFRATDGLRLSLDLATYPDCCMAVGLYELDTYRQIRRLLQPGMWFVDVGANLGYFSLIAARRVGASGRVDAIEPDPLNRQRLEANIQANDDLPCRIQVHAVAAAERDGSLELYHPLDVQANHGMASAYGSLFERSEKYMVRAVRLDQLLPSVLGVPDLVKMDVEGGELLAIEGITRWLQSERPPALIVEHNQASAAAAGFKPGDILRRLLEIQPRYQVSWIGGRLHPVTSPEQLDGMPRQVNLLARATGRQGENAERVARNA